MQLSKEQYFAAMITAMMDEYDTWQERIEEESVATPDELDEYTAEYVDDQLDREYHARGNW